MQKEKELEKLKRVTCILNVYNVLVVAVIMIRPLD
jgi:hypothetical protein